MQFVINNNSSSSSSNSSSNRVARRDEIILAQQHEHDEVHLATTTTIINNRLKQTDEHMIMKSLATNNSQTTRMQTRKRNDKQFVTKMAVVCTICSIGILCILTLVYSEWRDVISAPPDYSSHTVTQFHRDLAQQDNYNDQDANNSVSSDGDYSSYRCDEIFKHTTQPSSSSSTTSSSNNNEQCQYASTCDEGNGLLLPFVFCHTSIISTTLWLLLLSPLLLLLLTLLFRLLGSTAEEYFSPSLEMFSVKLGLPPRFAGVTLLALGNGAADVSATMNAIASDPTNGYKMSLGAL